VTVEENVLQGGAGSAVNEFLNSLDKPMRIINLGIPDAFIEHGDQQQQLAECGLDSSGILAAIKAAADTAVTPASDSTGLQHGKQLNG
jgi:1-deoxy-D-xylulose-5-phosphate synthase